MAKKRGKKRKLKVADVSGSVWRMAALISGTLAILAFFIFLTERGINEKLGATVLEQIGNSIWLTIVTVGTVGYGDMSAVTWPGKLASIGVIFMAILGLGFLVSRIQTAVDERQRRRVLGMDGTQFKNHVIVCYWTPISAIAIKELLAAERKVAVITEDQNSIPLIRQMGDDRSVFVTVGDPTVMETLERCAIHEASTVIAASDEDTKNLILALQVKQINPNARIVVSTKRSELRSTLTASGVTYVASPYEMSGRLVASAAFEPEVAHFIEDVSSGAQDKPEDEGHDLQQFSIPEGSHLCNQSVAQVTITLKQIKGPLLVAVSKHMGGGQYKVFPHPDENVVLYPSDGIIVLGTSQQNACVADMLGVIQGR